MGDSENVEDLTDLEIINRFISGEDKIFSILYKRYYQKVYLKCLGMTHDEHIAEDQVQEIFIKALEAVKTFKSEAKFSTWLYAITYNHCIDYLRKNKRIRFADWDAILDVSEDPDDKELNAIKELNQEKIILLLEFLKPEDKAIIILKYWEEMDLERIQYILSIENSDILKMRLYRARKRLRAIYKKFEIIF